MVAYNSNPILVSHPFPFVSLSFLAMENNFLDPNPRGRPSGSKNKCKEPERPSQGMEQYSLGTQLKVLEVAPGDDVINAVSDFANHLNVNLSVISTHGLVRNLTVYQPRLPPQCLPRIHYGCVYDMLGLKGNFYGSLSMGSHYVYGVDHQGNAVGGIVPGTVVAVTKVFVGIVIWRDTDCIKLPLTPREPTPGPRPLPGTQCEACSRATGSIAANGALCYYIDQGYLCSCAVK